MNPATTLTLSRPAGALTRFGGRVSSLFRAFELAMQVRKERRMLNALDEHILKDLGLDQAIACAEADRRFWDVPVDRLRV